MRWLFHDKANAAEAAYYAETLMRIDAWWEAFVSKTDDLDRLFSQQAEWDLPAWMHEHLGAIHEQLMWEYGPAIDCDGHRLVITPESNRHLRPMVQTLLDRAPEIPGWEFYAYRLPESLEMVRGAVEARTGGDVSDVRVQAAIGEHNLIDLTFRSPSCFGDEDQQSHHDAFVATESLLGEEVLDKWIGAIEAAPLPKKGLLGFLKRDRATRPQLIPLDRLRDTVAALMGSIQDQLPGPASTIPFDDEPDESGPQWSSLTREAPVQDEYPGRLDLYVATCARPDALAAAHAGSCFHSSRFSRHGETFCYLKIDGRGGLDEERFQDRGDIEQGLHAALGQAGVGGVFGGGTGRVYSYVDMALTDIQHALEIIRSFLRAGNIPNRTWVLFFDPELAEEWVGIYDDTPPPPSEEEA